MEKCIIVFKLGSTDVNRELISYLEKNIIQLVGLGTYVTFVTITNKNAKLIANKYNINNVPALILGNKKYYGVGDIISYLSTMLVNSRSKKDTVCKTIDNFMLNEALSKDEEEDKQDKICNTTVKKMEEYRHKIASSNIPQPGSELEPQPSISEKVNIDCAEDQMERLFFMGQN